MLSCENTNCCRYSWSFCCTRNERDQVGKLLTELLGPYVPFGPSIRVNLCFGLELNISTEKYKNCIFQARSKRIVMTLVHGLYSVPGKMKAAVDLLKMKTSQDTVVASLTSTLTSVPKDSVSARVCSATDIVVRKSVIRRNYLETKFTNNVSQILPDYGYTYNQIHINYDLFAK